MKGTLHYALRYTKTDKMELIGYSDADWASDKEDRRSTTGYYFCLNPAGPAISWKTRKQPTVALSTCESEYMALAETTQEALYLKKLLLDLKENITVQPVQLFGDNQGSIAMISNPVKHSRSKHIDIKYHFIRDSVSNGTVNVSYVSTNDNIADVMTKPMTKFILKKFESRIFGK